MEFKDKIFNIVKEELPGCVKTGSAVCHLKGNIPCGALQGAIRTYASSVEPDDVVALIDTTIFGGGERGMLLTYDSIYYKGMLCEPTSSSYYLHELFDAPEDVYFSAYNISRMLSKLSDAWEKEYVDSEIEETTLGEDLLAFGINYLEKKTAEWLNDESEAAKGMCIELKDILIDWIKALSTDADMDSSVEDEDEFWDKSDKFYTNALFLGDTEEVKGSIDGSKTEDAELIETNEAMRECFNAVDNIINELIDKNPELGLEKVNVVKGANVYWRRIDEILDEAIAMKVYEKEEIERMQRATEDFVNILKRAVRQINKIIDMFESYLMENAR
uniref:hypothetical protein n=1 Tax=Acetatifactor sp. TaxID=1872090 RepID=UPI004055E8C5